MSITSRWLYITIIKGLIRYRCCVTHMIWPMCEILISLILLVLNCRLHMQFQLNSIKYYHVFYIVQILLITKNTEVHWKTISHIRSILSMHYKKVEYNMQVAKVSEMMCHNTIFMVYTNVLNIYRRIVFAYKR